MYVGSESPASISLSKEINQPVFIIDSTESVISGKNKGCYSKINPDVPSLEKLGFTKIQAPYSLCQNIYHFISNVLRENPDVRPPVEISNENKIIAGGFNLNSHSDIGNNNKNEKDFSHCFFSCIFICFILYYLLAW